MMGSNSQTVCFRELLRCWLYLIKFVLPIYLLIEVTAVLIFFIFFNNSSVHIGKENLFHILLTIPSFHHLMILAKMSMGTGKMMVLLFSAEMLLKVCRYRSWGWWWWWRWWWCRWWWWWWRWWWCRWWWRWWWWGWWCQWGMGRWWCCCSLPRCCSTFADSAARKYSSFFFLW